MLARCESVVMKLQERVLNLTEKVDELENRSGRNNLIVYIISESGDETEPPLRERFVKNIFQGTMKVTVESVERIHKLGRKQEKRSRPSSCVFTTFNEKVQLRSNARALRCTGLSISEDYL